KRKVTDICMRQAKLRDRGGEGNKDAQPWGPSCSPCTPGFTSLFSPTSRLLWLAAPKETELDKWKEGGGGGKSLTHPSDLRDPLLARLSAAMPHGGRLCESLLFPPNLSMAARLALLQMHIPPPTCLCPEKSLLMRSHYRGNRVKPVVYTHQPKHPGLCGAAKLLHYWTFCHLVSTAALIPQVLPTG
ncbi:hypothetical protein KUCAC02_011662, partial [Chaenocephalus aceratus]